jgi:hypothetical protein
MPVFRRKFPNHLVSIHPDNAANGDWMILLEACTIVGPSPTRLRVARTTQERKVVRRWKWFRRKPYVVVEGFDPRIHRLYFCPQLYKFDGDSRLIPLDGEEMGRLVAQALEGSVKSRLPWYEPTERLPNDPIIVGDTPRDFDTLVVDKPTAKPTLVRSAAE